VNLGAMRRMKQVEARRRRSMTAPALTTRQRDALLTAQRLLAGTNRKNFKPIVRSPRFLRRII
jgi:hypothetical protein